MKVSSTKKLVESALLIALGTVLSLIKIADMPMGGSVTLASMLPVVLIAYRFGTAWGFGAGFVYALLQQLLGLDNLSYVTTWQSVVAVILLDYIFAFALLGLGGVFRKSLPQELALPLGALLGATLRYLCHTIAGATVWAGLSIPDSAAIGASAIYNAGYMIPETVVLLLVAGYLGKTVDFTRPTPSRRISPQNRGKLLPGALALATLLLLGAVIADVALLAPAFQDENGFSLAGLSAAPWVAVLCVTGGALLLGACLSLVAALRDGRAGK